MRTIMSLILATTMGCATVGGGAVRVIRLVEDGDRVKDSTTNDVPTMYQR